MIIFASLLVAAAPGSPPAPASTFLSAVASEDLGAARGTFSDDVVIMDARGGHFADSSLAAFAAYVRGCARSALTWDVDADDPGRAAVSVAWTCPSRASAQAFIWTAGTRVVHIQFGLPPAR